MKRRVQVVLDVLVDETHPDQCDLWCPWRTIGEKCALSGNVPLEPLANWTTILKRRTAACLAAEIADDAEVKP